MVSLPNDIFEKLLCSECSKSLSVFPIMTKNDSLVICGRCYDPDDTDFNQNKIYETIAEFIRFPCIYSDYGCTRKLYPSEMKKHEFECYHRIYECPARSKCEWMGDITLIQDHFQETHPYFIIKNNQFEIDLTKSKTNIYLLIQNEKIFLFSQTFDVNENNLRFTVLQFLEESDFCLNYQITIYNGKKDKSIKLPPKSTSNYSKDSVTIVQVDEIKTKLADPAIIIGAIEFVNNNVKEKLLNEFNPLLQELDCMVCEEYMIPPIRICEAGHSVCETCLNSINLCPLCQIPIVKFKPDIVLKKLVHQLVGSCKFKNKGCDYTDKLEYMKEHHQYCQFAPQPCPLQIEENCEWSGTPKALLCHVQKNHIENFIEFNVNEIYLGTDAFVATYMKIFEGRLFKLNFSFDTNELKWALQLIGTAQESAKYKFEIIVSDTLKDGLKTKIRRNCSSISKENIFENNEEVVSLLLEQVKSYISNKFITFELLVYSVNL